MSKTLLAIETATESCSVALLHQDEVTEIYHLQPRMHAKIILPSIEQILADSGISLQQVDGYVCSIGPGSFTGVRIGVAITQGLAYSTQKGILPVPTTKIMAQGIAEQTDYQYVSIALDARMAEVYYAEYRKDSTTGLMQTALQECVLPPEKIQAVLSTVPTCAAGSGWQVYQSTLENQTGIRNVVQAAPHAKHSLSFAQQMTDEQFVSAENLQPLYCRNEVVRKK